MCKLDVPTGMYWSLELPRKVDGQVMEGKSENLHICTRLLKLIQCFVYSQVKIGKGELHILVCRL